MSINHTDQANEICTALNQLLQETSDRITSLSKIVQANKQRIPINEIDILPVINPVINLIDFGLVRNENQPAASKLVELQTLMRDLHREAEVEILRFRVFDKPEDDPIHWVRVNDGYNEGVDYRMEYLHWLGRGYFSPEQEEQIWDRHMINVPKNWCCFCWDKIIELATLYLENDDRLRPWHERTPDLHPDYRAKLWDRMKHLAETRVVQEKDQKSADLLITEFVDMVENELTEETRDALWSAFIGKRIEDFDISTLISGNIRPRFCLDNRFPSVFKIPERLKEDIAKALETFVLPYIGNSENMEETISSLKETFPTITIPERLEVFIKANALSVQ